MIQPFHEIEESYKTPDPWGYQTNSDDLIRKHLIIGILRCRFGYFERALDIGAGEGWITYELPARIKEGYEISEQARSRMPFHVIPTTKPEGKYDLIVATGVLYQHYDVKDFFRIMRECSSKVILTCNIATMEHHELKEKKGDLAFLNGKEIFSATFPYREFVQQMRIFKIA